jgi:D-sedoheptulose 7-phosphate isomerase
MDEKFDEYFAETMYAINVIDCNDILKIVHALKNARKEGKKIFLCGNGGSAGTAIHMAADLFKMAEINAITLNENMPLFTALVNDDGWRDVYLAQLEQSYQQGDILICFSVHGGVGKDKAGRWSENLLEAIDFVNMKKGITIGITGFDGGAMKDVCSMSIVVDSRSTWIVESIHCLLHHLIVYMLYEGDRE